MSYQKAVLVLDPTRTEIWVSQYSEPLALGDAVFIWDHEWREVKARASGRYQYFASNIVHDKQPIGIRGDIIERIPEFCEQPASIPLAAIPCLTTGGSL